MPEISVEHEQSPHGYGIKAEDTIWCKQGILTRRQLRDSEDEQIMLDLLASVVLGKPIAASREAFDKSYDREMADSTDLENALLAYGEDRIRTELLGTFSVLTDMIAQVSTENNFLRSKIRPGGNNPIKGPFYALFMAVFNLIVRQEKSPDRVLEIFDALINTGLAQQRYAKSHRILANCRGVKDFRRFRNSQGGTWFSRSVLGA